MCWNYDPQNFISNMFLQPDVRAFLPNYYPSVSLQCLNDFVIIQTWDFTHIANSTFSACSIAKVSSSTGSKYSSIASLIFFRASSFVSPSEIHPGREGTMAVYPPSSLGSKYTLIFIFPPSYISIIPSLPIKLTFLFRNGLLTSA